MVVSYHYFVIFAEFLGDGLNVDADQLGHCFLRQPQAVVFAVLLEQLPLQVRAHVSCVDSYHIIYAAKIRLFGNWLQKSHNFLGIDSRKVTFWCWFPSMEHESFVSDVCPCSKKMNKQPLLNKKCYKIHKINELRKCFWFFYIKPPFFLWYA